jgi:hypothetical protein
MNWVRSRRRLRAVRSVSHNRLIGESPLATVRCQFRTSCSQFTSPLERQRIESPLVTLALFEGHVRIAATETMRPPSRCLR